MMEVCLWLFAWKSNRCRRFKTCYTNSSETIWAILFCFGVVLVTEMCKLDHGIFTFWSSIVWAFEVCIQSNVYLFVCCVWNLDLLFRAGLNNAKSTIILNFCCKCASLDMSVCMLHHFLTGMTNYDVMLSIVLLCNCHDILFHFINQNFYFFNFNSVDILIVLSSKKMNIKIK